MLERTTRLIIRFLCVSLPNEMIADTLKEYTYE